MRCAACLMLFWSQIGHAGAFPLFGPVGQHAGMLDLLARGIRTLVWGPPAVIVFFVISGFLLSQEKYRCSTVSKGDRKRRT
jgi:peptidoglycan/LPS O-acetylase OafA/YrhL